jgi:hypothetical protein
MVLNEEGMLQPSCNGYDKRVAGIISGAVDYKPGITLGKTQERIQKGDESDNRKMRATIALIGIVYCKADATVQPIEIGDLLTTSSTPGHAMKARDPSKSFGAVIGKARKALRQGKGLVPVLVALQ